MNENELAVAVFTHALTDLQYPGQVVRAEKFFADQEKRDLLWRPQYWTMSMRTILEIAKAIVGLAGAVSRVGASLKEIALELRKNRLRLL